MKVFTKKETPVQNLAFCAIIAGFDGILSLVSALLPLSAFFLMLIAPLLSALIGYFCQKRYYAVYLFGALGVSIAVSAWNFENTLFYLLPALCSGTAYGFFLRRETNVVMTNFVVAMIQYSFFWLSLLLVKAIYEVDMREVIRSLLSLKSSDLLYDSFSLFALAYSFAVTGLSHLFFSLQAPHIGIVFEDKKKTENWYPAIAIVSGLFCVLFIFIYAKLAYFFLGCAFYWALAGLMSRFPKPHWSTYLLLGVTMFASILLIAYFFQSVSISTAILTFVAFPLSLALSSLPDVFLGLKRKSN